MKFNSFIAIAFILLISMENVIMTKYLTKNTKSKNKKSKSLAKRSKTQTKTKTKSQTKTKTKSNDFSRFITEVKSFKGKDLYQFFYGIFTIFFPTLNDKNNYDVMINYYDTKSLADCFPSPAVFQEDLTPIASTIFTKAQSNIGNPKKYCEDTKDKFKQQFRDALNHEKSKSKWEWWASVETAFNIPTQNAVCEKGWSNASQDMKKSLGNNEGQFKTECYYFMKMDCDAFKPEGGSELAFAKTAWGLVKSLWSKMECVKNKLAANTSDPMLIVFTGALSTAVFSAAIKFTVNFLTGGIWGGLQAAYNIIQLGLALKKYFGGIGIDDKPWPKPYLYGRLVGRAALIIKNLVGGRRRRRRYK